MDSAWMDWALQSGLNINEYSDDKESDNAKRHKKLDSLMNELAIQVGINREVLKKYQGIEGPSNRIRRSLIEHIKMKIDDAEEGLIDKVALSDNEVADRISRQVNEKIKLESKDYLEVVASGNGDKQDVHILWEVTPKVELLLQILIISSVVTVILCIIFKICCLLECCISCCCKKKQKIPPKSCSSEIKQGCN